MVFSILMANYNNSAFIQEAVYSVIDQTFQDWELLIIDDASTDNSISIIKEIASKDGRIRVLLHDTNKGIGYSKRELVAESRGEVFGFLDPDDYLSPKALEVMVDAHRAMPDTGLIYSTLIHVDYKGNEIGVSSYNKPVPEGTTFMSSGGISHFCTIKRSFYNLTEGINPLLRIAEDQDLYMKLEEVAPVHFVNLPLYYYRSHSGAISLNGNITRSHVWQMIARYEAYKRRDIPIDENHLIKYFISKEEKFNNFYFNMYQPKHALLQFLKAVKKWTLSIFRLS
jgi:glycosyltransferase involved in cell wall biosynthesis